MARGIREVPSHLDATTRGFLQDMRQTVLDLRETLAPPRDPGNFAGSVQPVAALLQWTGTDADYYLVYWNTTPNLATAQQVPVGTGTQWVDHVGQAGIARFYWVQGVKNIGRASNVVGPVKVTSGAIGAGVTPPISPPISDQIIRDIRTNAFIPRGPVKGGP